MSPNYVKFNIFRPISLTFYEIVNIGLNSWNQNSAGGKYLSLEDGGGGDDFWWKIDIPVKCTHNTCLFYYFLGWVVDIQVEFY